MLSLSLSLNYHSEALSLSSFFSLKLLLSQALSLSMFFPLSLSQCLFFFLSLSLTISLSLSLCFSLSEALSLSLFCIFSLFLYLCIHPSIYPSIYPSICLSVFLSISFFFSLLLSLSLYIYICTCIYICIYIQINKIAKPYLCLCLKLSPLFSPPSSSLHIILSSPLSLFFYRSFCLVLFLSSLVLLSCLHSSLQSELLRGVRVAGWPEPVGFGSIAVCA